MELLNASGISVSYGKIGAIRDVSMRIVEGQIVTIVGPNGAGKSTFLKALMGWLPYQGSMRFAGRPIDTMTVQDRVCEGMVLVPETRELFAQMTVADNLLLGGYIHRRQGHAALAAELDRIYELFPRLRERMHQQARTLSGGERQMLALGRALMGRPRLLMLDEPSLGLAPLIVREIFEIIARLRSLNVSILLVEQNARAALQTADYAYVLETGEVPLHGPAAELLKDPRIANVYLGSSAS
ncbi:ABC transporter ATP-binding protein [Ruixingdingia sedimenti]|uniref:ABC transporter ATP-binding protein n=1 Tax=Ruixingdingia sedimenti TaxID=3073604 RepID=A0ABU1FD72_9RHOB|nr:ABC transporter ATP-binding protein [Xinfangfangia sp. LG-4]MDR5654806.1 ABC transporter ATP-binding protein [Xinfangfangia sp. LG-4]